MKADAEKKIPAVGFISHMDTAPSCSGTDVRPQIHRNYDGGTLILNKEKQIQLTPEGEIVLDVTGRKNGRGAYLCFSKECLQKAIKNKGLERSLKMQIPQEVYENLERELDTIEL